MIFEVKKLKFDERIKAADYSNNINNNLHVLLLYCFSEKSKTKITSS